jgi:hypothetical protein
MVTLDTVVRILLSGMKRGRDQLIDRSPQRRGSVGHNLDRCAVRVEC